MAERKDTNPFTSDDPDPHLPPTVYQPHPFPYNPAEGNPWAATKDQPYQHAPYQQGHTNSNTASTYSYGHGDYNTSSDNGSQSSHPSYIPMPTPTVYTY